MTPKLWNCQNLLRKRGIFLIVCGICRGVDKKQISKCQYWCKNHSILHNNKAWSNKCTQGLFGMSVHTVYLTVCGFSIWVCKLLVVASRSLRRKTWDLFDFEAFPEKWRWYTSWNVNHRLHFCTHIFFRNVDFLSSSTLGQMPQDVMIIYVDFADWCQC